MEGDQESGVMSGRRRLEGKQVAMASNANWQCQKAAMEWRLDDDDGMARKKACRHAKYVCKCGNNFPFFPLVRATMH